MPNVVAYTLASLTAALISECEEDATFSDLFVAQVPNFIQRAESRCYGDLNFEIFDRQAIGQFTASVYLQPIKTAAWQGTRSLFIRANLAGSPTGRRFEMLKRSRDYCVQYEPNEANTGRPLYYSEHSETQLFVTPPPDQAYHFELRQIADNATQSLIDVSPTWLSTNAGDLLFFASMIEAETWLQADKPEIDKWMEKYAGRLVTDRLTLRENIRVGDYSPVQDSAKTVGDSQ
jgi:hypothetical protein